MNEAYIPYTEIASVLGLKPGERVYLSSDIMALAFTAKKNQDPFDMDRLLDSFQKAITDSGTLLIPTFNFDFSNYGKYDYRNTPTTTGALGNAALKRTDFKRTRHPMHSFAVWGKDKDLLCEMKNLNSFGEDSPFGYMHKQNVTQVMLGTDYQRSMTFVHYVENMAEVPYRFYKEFTGSYVDESGDSSIRTYQYPARYLEYGSTEQFNRIGSILEEKEFSHKYMINGIPVNKVRLSDSYSVIYEDAKNNQCRNLYDFEIERSKIWNK